MSNMAHCILYIAGALFIAIVIVYHELNFCYFQVQSAKTKYLLFFQRQKSSVSCGMWHMADGSRDFQVGRSDGWKRTFRRHTSFVKKSLRTPWSDFQGFGVCTVSSGARRGLR
jgi:hypothetical protein